MSPDQARGEGVDGRSDLYAMGVVLYQLLCGRPPFVADTPFGIAIQHVSEPPIPPSRYRAVNPVLESICLRALNKLPEDRFQTAREMRRVILSSLTSYSESGMASAHQTSTPILSFAASSVSAASTDLEVRHSTAPSTPDVPKWLRYPKAIIAAVAFVIGAIFALISLIARDVGQDNGKVVRAATVALVPAPQANPVSSSSEGATLAPTQPSQTPILLPDDRRPPAAASESESRARPAAEPSPAPRR
jgi:serine/threonine-protein kinase